MADLTPHIHCWPPSPKSPHPPSHPSLELSYGPPLTQLPWDGAKGSQGEEQPWFGCIMALKYTHPPQSVLSLWHTAPSVVSALLVVGSNLNQRNCFSLKLSPSGPKLAPGKVHNHVGTCEGP